jgi:NodT family efflux transporter outer membrane factor (OMF) lipoprotein
MKKHFSLALLTGILSACTVGPDYVRPPAVVPVKYKEATSKQWKVATPQDNCNRGEWWRIFNDAQLNALESQVNISNQTIKTNEAQYRQAVALVNEARANYFPTVTGAVSITRQKSGSGGSSGTFLSSSSSSTAPATNPDGSPSTAGSFSSVSSGANITTSHSLLLNATWEPDIWGNIRRTVEASIAGAQATAAQVALARLSAQASLAQFYFELRGLDNSQKILNNTVNDYKRALALTQHQYAAGVVARADIIQAQSQLQSAQALAINNGVNRAIYEHAIATLIGVPPSCFSLAARAGNVKPPFIPTSVPSALLERRPDIAQAERLAAQASAQIGVAIAAYYPTLTLTASTSYQHQGFNNWFSLPGAGWSLGPQLAETLFDGGLRKATVDAARANYDATIASYRQVVLAAFQDVEDNLSSLRILKQQYIAQSKAAASARHALALVMNQYKAGVVPYSSVITAQIAAYTAEKSASDVMYLEMTSASGLVKALGGGWNAAYIY